MMIKFSKTKLTIIVIIALISLGVSGVVLARDLQVDYPEGGPTTTNVGMGGYISYIFNIAMMLAGVIIFVGLIYAGFQYLTSAGNPQAQTTAKNRITGSLIGLVLLLGSFLILRAINPDLLGLDVEDLKPSHGICLFEESGGEGNFYCYTESPKSLPDNFEPQSIEFLNARTTEREEGYNYQTSDNIEAVYTFKNEDWNPGGDEYDGRIKNPKESPGDDGITNISNFTESLYIEWASPGVYLYKEEDFKLGFPASPYQVHQSNVRQLDDEYNNNVASMRFRPFKCEEGTAMKKGTLGETTTAYYPEAKYGAVLHTETEHTGECGIAFGKKGLSFGAHDYCTITEISDLGSAPYSMEGSNTYIHPIGKDQLSSMTVFNHDVRGKSSGKIVFYEQTAQAGDYFEIDANNINEFWKQNDISYPLKNKGYITVQDGDDALDDSEMDEILSIKIEGAFMVVLTRENEFGGRCQTFKNSVSTLNGKYVLRGNRDARVRSIAIIPLKE